VETQTPVVLVHGLAGSARWWRDAEAALRSRHAVHALDLPGFGAARRERFAFDAAAGAVADRAEQLGRVHLVGHSLGGLVCAHVAAARPELVDRLVLVAPAGSLPRRSLLGHAWPLAATLRSARPSFLRLAVADALRAGPRTVFHAARDVLRHEVAAELRAIAAPTLLVWGERDALVPPSVGRLFETEIPDARLELLEGAGHVPMIERPDAFSRTLLAFLQPRSG
jgi:pimeloyl-ACP methyl ester carboxylesterase